MDHPVLPTRQNNERSSLSDEAPERLAELDWAKGVAILAVVLIHAKALEGRLFDELFVQRAVPIFLVLFGMTSEFWWQRRCQSGWNLQTTLAWYRQRFLRLIIPVWAAASLWWVSAAALDLPLRFGWPQILASYLGYSPWIGVSWFVTLVLQLVVLFPLLRSAGLRLGATISLAASAMLVLTCQYEFWPIIHAGKDLLHNTAFEPGFFYFWIFPPRVFLHVIAGIFLARAGLPNRPAALLSMLLIIGLVWMLDTSWYPPVVGPALFSPLADVPVTVLLLAALRAWTPPTQLGETLRWLGQYSWGLYLAHTLVHAVVHFLGFSPEELGPAQRWAYAALLLASGSALAWSGQRLRHRAFPAQLT